MTDAEHVLAEKTRLARGITRLPAAFCSRAGPMRPANVLTGGAGETRLAGGITR